MCLDSLGGTGEASFKEERQGNGEAKITQETL